MTIGNTVRRFGLSRRGLLTGTLLLVGGAALPFASAEARAVARAPRARRAIVAFHDDRLYLDPTGEAEAYVPPPGLRTLDGHDADALARLVYAL